MKSFYARKPTWLMGFDFDGTLADPENDHQVDARFFKVIKSVKEYDGLTWGICTGRSLEFTIDGIQNAKFPFLPDYLITKEREIFYNDDGQWIADELWNQKADQELDSVLERSKETIQKAKRFIEAETAGQWVETEGEPAAIIAECEKEVQEVVDIFEDCSEKCDLLEYQRNTIYLRFSHKSFSKGTAFSHIRNQLSVPLKKSLTVGDNFNDLSMLNDHTAAHYGCPSNSLPSLIQKMQSTKGSVARASCSLGVIELIENAINQ